MATTRLIQTCKNMARTKTLMLLFVISLVALHPMAANKERKTQGWIYKGALLTKEPKELIKFPSLLEGPYKGRQGKFLEVMPVDFVVLFETTVYLETTLFSVVLLYGFFSLHCWPTLCQKCIDSKAKQQHTVFSDEEFEMARTEQDEDEASYYDVIVYCSDEEV